MYIMRTNWKHIANIRQNSVLFEKCLSLSSTTRFCSSDRTAARVSVSTGTVDIVKPRMAQRCRCICVIKFHTLTGKNHVYQPFVLHSKLHTSHIRGECVKSSDDPHTHSQSDSIDTDTSLKKRYCWVCGRDTSPVRELFFCDCGVVQKPASELTYFDLMQLKPSFDIDTKKLGDIFKETQKRLHPDKFSSKSQDERDLAQQQSALLNKAYNIIQKPLSRAIYLLGLQNIEISEKDNFTEPEFLMEIMEINEQISSAKEPSDVETLETSNEAKIAKCVREISELYNRNLIDDMKRATIQLRYYTTIQERINEIKRSKME